ncbi:hypothetical protein HID58_090803, partial [Brassica napus]
NPDANSEVLASIAAEENQFIIQNLRITEEGETKSTHMVWFGLVANGSDDDQTSTNVRLLLRFKSIPIGTQKTQYKDSKTKLRSKDQDSQQTERLIISQRYESSTDVVFGFFACHGEFYRNHVELFLDDKINRAEVLFPGVGCFLIAVFLGAAVHYSNATDVKAKLESLPSEDFYSSIKKGEDNPEKVEKAKAGTAGFFVELENKRAIKFLGGQAAGYAAADSVQALPLVSTFWGIICLESIGDRPEELMYFSLACCSCLWRQWPFSWRLLVAVRNNCPTVSRSTKRRLFQRLSLLTGEKPLHPHILPRWWLRRRNSILTDFITLSSLQPSPPKLLSGVSGLPSCAGVSDSDPVRRLVGCSETPPDELETRDEAMRKMIEAGWRTVSPNSVNGADDPLINVVGSGDSDLSSSFCDFIVCIESEKMYMIESKGGAIACMLLALLFLGTWPAIMTLTERRGRLPQHTYLDYTITNLLAAVIIAFTLGQIVTEVVTSSITVVIGTTLNYFLDDRINRAEILFPGAACFLIAVCFGSAVHKSNAADNKSKLQNFNRLNNIHNYLETTSSFQIETNHANSGEAKEGTAAFLIELEKQRAIKVFGKSTIIGLAITFFAGICFSMFSPAFNLATNDQWHTLKHGVPKLSVYTAFFYFSISAFVIALILNIRFLYWPVLGLPRSSFKAYLNDWNGRGWSFLAGFLCGFGNGLQFMGGQAAGYAAADAVQALPLVSTFWGILLFGEYRRSSRRTYVLLISMLFMFIVAVASMKLALETVLLRMEKSPKRILSTFTNGCSMFKSVKMLGLPERCENADFFTSNNIDDRHYMILIILSRLQRPACEAPPDNATELSSRTCSFSGLLELLRSSVYQDFCSTALATSLYALIVHQSEPKKKELENILYVLK